MKTFVYIFKIKDRDALLSHDCTLIKSDNANNIFIFLNDENFKRVSEETDVLNDISLIYSDSISY